MSRRLYDLSDSIIVTLHHDLALHDILEKVWLIQ